MKRKYCKIVLFLITVLFISISNCKIVNASPTTTTTTTAEGSNISYEIWKDVGMLNGASVNIISIIQWVGLMVLVGAIIVKGIKYVSVSPEGKAEIKKEIIMLTIGAVLLLAVTTILGVIIKLVQDAGLQ